MNRRIRILFITYSSWREDNNNGNSYSTIFGGMEDKIEFANIYFKDDMPKNKIVHRYFHISEKELLKSAFNRQPVGEEMYLDNPFDTPNATYSSIYNKARVLRWNTIFLIRDYLTVSGKWKTKELDAFVEDFKPDIIFGNLHFIPVYNRIMRYLSKRFDIPLVLYPWDDFYSTKRFSYSPMFWLRFWLERLDIKKCAAQASYMYCITRQMQEEYTRYFDKECKILYKGRMFEGEPPVKSSIGKPVRLLYMGNIGSGRWKELGKIATVLSEINSKEPGKSKLDVYTLSPHTLAITKALNIEGTSTLHEPVDVDVVEQIRNEADILVHVEPTKYREMLTLRLSFSTKIVDYFYNARAILAIGGETSAMDYLRRNDGAIVETDTKKFDSLIKELIYDEKKILEYGRKAWECGVRNHRIQDIQRRIFSDFCEIIKSK